MREQAILDILQQSDNFRSLLTTTCGAGILRFQGREYVNLSSNDYLGLSGRLDLQEQFFGELPSGEFLMSNPSSRLMCGNSEHYGALEEVIASFYGAEAALVCGSGYALNSSILRAVVDKDSVILADRLVHASLNDGMLLSGCRFERFAHNDMDDLERLLKRYSDRGHVVVVVEGLYSMDGDRVRVEEILELKSRYDFELMVDEAHSLGVFGERGEGVFPEEAPVDYRIATLGKACASVGGFVVCTRVRREVLVNRMRSTIFSTAMPPINLLWSRFIFERMADFVSERTALRTLIDTMGGESQIIPLMTSSAGAALELRDTLIENGFWATAIRSPTVKKGTERVRLSLSAAHKPQDIERLCKLIG